MMRGVLARLLALAALALLAACPAALAVPPQLTLSGNGEDPHLAVDAEGTGHFVWTEPGPGINHTVTRYCHVLAGTNECEPGSDEGLDPSTKDPADTNRNNTDFGGPKVFVSGSTVFIATHRCCGFRDHPDGSTNRTDTLYLFTSNDGGHTFDTGRIIGTEDPLGDAALGPGNTISVISHVNTLGMPYQAAPLTGYTGASAQFNDNRNSYNGTVAFRDHPANTQPVTAWDDLDNVFFAVHNGGDYNNTANWTERMLGPGEEPRLTSGPSGLFLLHQTGSPGSVAYVSRRWNGSEFAPGVPVSETGSPVFADFFQDGDGRLHAVWAGSPREINYARSADGAKYPRAGLLTKDGGDHFNLEVAANGAGNGWVAWDSNSVGRVAAVPLVLAPSVPITLPPGGKLEGGRIVQRVGCPDEVGECAGVIRLRTAGRVNVKARSAARRILNLGKRAFRMQAGQTRRIRVKVPRRSLPVLRRLRRVRVRAAIRLTYAFGEPRTVVRNLRIKTR
jgi:hypothetical protein